MVQLLITDQSRTLTDQALTIRISYDIQTDEARFERDDESFILRDGEQSFRGSSELRAMTDAWMARATRIPAEYAVEGPDDEEFWNLIKQEYAQ